MAFTMLSLDDFSGMESTPNMTRWDCLLDVAKVAWEKSKKEEMLLLSSSSQILDFVPPKGKRSMPNRRPRKVTQQLFVGDDQSMIKKAVEQQQQQQQHRVKPENRLIKINWKGSSSANFVSLPINRKRSRRQVANNGPFGFKNQERRRLVKKKKAKRNTVVVRVEVPPPPIVIIIRELNIAFKNRIKSFGGSLESVKLVIEKRIYESDADKNKGRLTIPIKQVSNEFLEPEEVELLNTRNDNRMCEMKVMLIEPSLETSQINLRKWFMSKDNGSESVSYVLLTHWNRVRERNGLKVGNMVQVWAFRKGTELCLALVKI